LAPARDRRARPTPAPPRPAPLSAAQRLASLRLIRSENVGPVTFRELIAHFGGAEAALEALPELSRRGGYRRPIRICPREAAEAELGAAADIGARALVVGEPGYPPALAAVDPPPPLLYAKGKVGHLTRPMLAIVGARNGSAAGQKLARLFATDVGAAGFVIVSGLARGIDSAAHEAALETGTVAVLAGGPDNVYPPEHAELQRRIAERGCLVSENPPGFAPRGQDFPRRNRIISGMALGVLVVEAARRSGTLVTARMAGEQGREVFALPGHPLDPRAEGTNRLLKSGATLVTEPEDILAALAPLLREAPQPLPLEPTRRTAPPQATLPLESAGAGGGTAEVEDADRARLIEALGPAPVDIDELGRATGLPARAIQIALLELALAGRIERHGHQLVSLKR
jgi:DNA processing protein